MNFRNCNVGTVKLQFRKSDLLQFENVPWKIENSIQQIINDKKRFRARVWIGLDLDSNHHTILCNFVTSWYITHQATLQQESEAALEIQFMNYDRKYDDIIHI